MRQRFLACLFPLLVIATCTLVIASCTRAPQPREEGELYLSELDGVEQRLVLKPDGTYVLRNPTSEYRGTYTRDGQTLTIVSDKNVRAVVTLDAEGFVDNGGIRWTRR